MFKQVYKLGDRLEDRVRGFLSRYPLVYALIAGIAIVFFYRGVWMIADMFIFLNGPVSFLLSAFVLLITGVLVSEFIGDKLIISGLKGEKKTAEKTREEVEQEAESLVTIKKSLGQIHEDLDRIEKKIEKTKIN